MKYLLACAALVVAMHGYQYGRWLIKNESKEGAIVVFLLVLLSIIFPLRELLTGI